MLTARRKSVANCKSGAGTAELGSPRMYHDLISGGEPTIDPRRKKSRPFGAGPE
jgi:hypothetical protein